METFFSTHHQTCKELESTVPENKKREALVTLMGKNGCPLCVLIIKENPTQYKAVFPHFLLSTLNTPYVPGLSKLNFCPMLNHLPRETRVKFMNKLTNQWLNCLKETVNCRCPDDSSGRCRDSGKSIYIFWTQEGRTPNNLKETNLQ